MANWFVGLHSVGEIKSHFRDLAMQHHPDRGGDTGTMQSIIEQYHRALEGQHGQTSVGDDGEERTYYYNASREESVIEKIKEVIAANVLQESVELWLLGTWLWIEGDTKPVKESLKEISFRWHSKRQMWYWHPPGYRSNYNSKASFGELVNIYNGQRVEDDDSRPTAPANPPQRRA